MKQLARKFWKSEDGATAIEYGLITALIALSIITTLQLLGPELVRIFQIIVDTLASI
ncbi:MAG: Flp family type IVb pilin [Hyphomicrobiaceae bacterium]|nr:Flp family type IVb pilin [Hyphomicrobiaceae bacterium]